MNRSVNEACAGTSVLTFTMAGAAIVRGRPTKIRKDGAFGESDLLAKGKGVRARVRPVRAHYVTSCGVGGVTKSLFCFFLVDLVLFLNTSKFPISATEEEGNNTLMKM